MRSRITNASVLATIVALLLFGVPLALTAASINRANERGELQRLALRAGSGIDPSVGRNEPIELPSTEANVTVGVYGTDGQLVSGGGPATGDAAVASALRGSYGAGVIIGDQTVVAVPVRSGETVVAAVRAASPTAIVTDRTQLTWLAMAGLALIAVGGAAVIARLQARRLAAPMEHVATVAAALGQGDLQSRAASSGIAEIDAVAAALNDSADRLALMLEHERSFAADASHQLRTPLTGLRWTLESALADPDADLRAAATAAIAGADSMERAVTELLVLTRASGHRPTTDLAPLLAELEEQWHGMLAASGRPLEFRVRGRPPQVAAAPAAIRNILAVLIDNAHRHGRGTVQLTVREASEAVAIDVADEGIAHLDPARIFRRGMSGGVGHGLGLALARRLAEAEQGRLILASTSGPTTFTLFLPEARSDPG